MLLRRSGRPLWVLGLLLSGLACQKQVERPDAAVSDAGAPEQATTAISAQRCGECHRTMFTEWRGSAHALADRTPGYLAMVGQSKGAGCEECHAPLLGKVDPGTRVAEEAITCDVCHTMVQVKPSPTDAGFALALQDNVKYGPFCDLKDHYFHRMGCSPIHAQAPLCGGCHWMYGGAPGKSLPVFTEYEEWLQRNVTRPGMDCQGCHMPEDKAPIAVGSPERSGVGHHGFFGRSGELRHQALRGQLTVASSAAGLHLEVELTNAEAGHDVPSGLPGRRVVLRAQAFGPDGALEDEKEIAYGRFLVDDSGAEVPFYRATRVARDTRLVPDERRVESIDLHAKGSGTLKVDVLWRPLSEVIARELGLSLPDQPMLSASFAYGPGKRHTVRLN